MKMYSLDIEYNNFVITVAYSKSGKTKQYTIWTKDFTDMVGETFKTIKSTKKYIDDELKKG